MLDTIVGTEGTTMKRIKEKIALPLNIYIQMRYINYIVFEGKMYCKDKESWEWV